MSRSTDCVPEETLIRLAEGALPDEERQAVETHLTGCVTCFTALEWIKLHLLRKLDSNGEPITTFLDRIDLADQRDVATRTFNGILGEEQGIAGPLPGEAALGKESEYQILRVLGHGGYGIVLEANDTVLQRRVAIKVLKRDLANRVASRRRFIREARAGAAINHPNVVTIHAVDEARDTPFLIMELIQGESLRDRIRREPKLDMIDVIRISAQIAQGLAAAHSQGIIHRDVKPGNIMLVDNVSRVKITDFGLARVAIEDVEFTSRSLAVGTPAYMSPEQVRGEDVDARSDLFALGCVMYAMVTGHSAYFGQTALEVARRIDTHEPPRLIEIDKRVPEFLSDIVHRLLQKEPGRRYQSAAEVADVLNRHLAMLNQTPTDKLPAVLRTPLIEVGPRKRHPLWVAVPLAAAALAFVALAVAWWSGWIGHGSRAENTSTSSATTATKGPPRPRQSEVSVAQSGPADAKTINEALELVAPGGTVTIGDAGEYLERLQITDSEAHAGLRIVALAQAKLRHLEKDPVVIVRGVPRVEIRGLTIIAPQSEHGIEVSGACPGLVLENLTIQRALNEDGSFDGNAALHLHCEGTPDEPIVVRRVTLRDTHVGLVIGVPDAPTAARHMLVEECRIFGHVRPGSTLLCLQGRCQEITLRRNIFAHGGTGLSLLAAGETLPERCELAHNSWHDVESWIGWTGELPASTTLRIHDNLIVAAGSMNADARTLSSLKSDEPVYQNNRLVNPGGSASAFAPAAASIEGLPIVSLDPAHPDYLKPDFAQIKNLGILTLPLPGRYATENEQ